LPSCTTRPSTARRTTRWAAVLLTEAMAESSLEVLVASTSPVWSTHPSTDSSKMVSWPWPDPSRKVTYVSVLHRGIRTVVLSLRGLRNGAAGCGQCPVSVCAVCGVVCGWCWCQVPGADVVTW
jgi:hypothetical protein